MPNVDQWNRKIFVIDGHPVYIHKTEGLLKSLSYNNVVLSSSGKGVAFKIDQEKPDLVILSGMLPDADAHEICRMIKESSQAKVIVQTGLFTPEEDVRKFQDVGADCVIDRKEKDLRPLQEAVENLLAV